MEFRLLRYFLAVVREGNISKAAEALFLTQPTLSRQLSDLEHELGAPLFVRGKKQITLTEAGLLLKRRAEEILELQEKAESEIRQRDDHLTGRLSVGAAEADCAVILPRLITKFKKKYPEVEFDLYSDTASVVKEKIDRGLLDAGLVIEPGSIDKYHFLPLGIKETCGILMNTASPLAAKDTVTVRDLIGLPVLISQREEVKNLYRNRLGEDFDKLDIIATHNLIGNAARFAEENCGYIFTVRGCVRNLTPETFCFRPFSPSVTQDSFLIWKKEQPVGRCLKKLIEEVSMLLKHTKQ